MIVVVPDKTLPSLQAALETSAQRANKNSDFSTDGCQLRSYCRYEIFCTSVYDNKSKYSDRISWVKKKKNISESFDYPNFIATFDKSISFGESWNSATQPAFALKLLLLLSLSSQPPLRLYITGVFIPVPASYRASAYTQGLRRKHTIASTVKSNVMKSVV